MTDVNMDFDEEDRLTGFNAMPLLEICLKHIVQNMQVLFYVQEPEIYSIRKDAILPAEICDELMNTYQETLKLHDGFANIFKDRVRTRVRKVKLRESTVTDEGLKIFLLHQPEELDIVDCENLTSKTVDNIYRNIDNMHTLCIGPIVPIFTSPIGILRPRNEIRPPKLRNLCLKGHTNLDLRHYPYILEPLSHLELSGCKLLIDKNCQLNNLVSLTLYNVQGIEENLLWICTIETLKHLDISQHIEKQGKFTNPNEKLAKLVTSLPHLKSLDISGTNLAGTGGSTKCDTSSVLCDIPGLSSRVKTPLHFLGLYGTSYNACCRYDIPAQRISGHANEEQILTAATLYMGRPDVLTKVLNDLYHLFRYETKKHRKALTIVLQAMDTHVIEKHIQICGSATLFYIVKGKKSDQLGIRLRRQIITTLLNGMEAHLDDPTMMRNGCLTLCQFKIPTDVIFDYQRVINILLNGVHNTLQENFVQRIAIYLLNSLACQVDAHQKRFLGDCGVISIMLSLITDRLERKICDDVLEVAWSTMWNVTDETPINCQRFLQDSGLNLFLGCLKSFPDKEELLRNMMGLLGNVAEVKDLRYVFMTEFLISEFVTLLDSDSDGIEVSYNAAGVLAHIASDGQDAWCIRHPTRQDVLDKMVEAINRWNINSRRNINYRSFEPLVGLLKTYHTPQCQHWAIWALANLTTVYPDKYCSLLKAEKGIELLTEIVNSPIPYACIKNLANAVLKNFSVWSGANKSESTLSRKN